MTQADFLRFAIDVLESLKILRISGELVDRAYVAEFVHRFGVLDVWNAVLRRIGEPVDEPPGGK